MSEDVTGLTYDEHSLLMKTADVYNEFCDLETLHPSDVEEFALSLHRIQDLIMKRPVQRILNREPR